MLIDVTRYPLVVMPEECPSMLVLRTITAGGVSGSVWQDAVANTPRNPYRHPSKDKYEVPPIEKLTRAPATYLETKLPLHEAREITPIASVFEAASVLGGAVNKDPVAAWRIRVSVLYKIDSKFWHVTVWDLSRNTTPLAVLATRDLDPDALTLGQATPLARARRTIGADMPLNAWTRILEDD